MCENEVAGINMDRKKKLITGGSVVALPSCLVSIFLPHAIVQIKFILEKILVKVSSDDLNMFCNLHSNIKFLQSMDIAMSQKECYHLFVACNEPLGTNCYRGTFLVIPILLHIYIYTPTVIEELVLLILSKEDSPQKEGPFFKKKKDRPFLGVKTLVEMISIMGKVSSPNFIKFNLKVCKMITKSFKDRK